MKLAFQLISRFEKTIFLGAISKWYRPAQIRYKHRTAKKLEVVSEGKSKCLEPAPPRKRSFWRLFRKPDIVCEVQKKPGKKDCETVPRLVSEEQAEIDMCNISKMGGNVYRTCGPAYILQKDFVEQPEIKTEPEEKILKEMMKHPSLKGQCDPMPPFTTAERRLLDLTERKLHPLYRKLMSVPKRPTAPKTTPFSKKIGPAFSPDIPKHLESNREIFENKNILFEFKKAEPPE